MRRNPSPCPARACSAAVVAAVLAAALAARPAAAQDGPVRQNRPADDPPPATRASPAPAAAARLPATDPDAPDATAVPVVDAPGPDNPPDNLSATALRADLGKSFGELTHPDPAVREAARVRLMGMSRSHLSAFEAVVHDSLPLAPAQATVLREIVTQAYLAGEPYPAIGRDPVGRDPVGRDAVGRRPGAAPDPAVRRDGFLGVKLAQVTIASRAADDGPDAPAADAAPARLPNPRLVPNPPFLPNNQRVFPNAPFDGFDATGADNTGVAIVERMPGFCGARMFRDGDVVLGILAGRRHVPTRTTEDMRSTVMFYGAGQTVRFEVLREGRVVRVPVVLDPRPDQADPLLGMQPLLDDRRAAVETYWTQTFAPLLKPKAG